MTLRLENISNSIKALDEKQKQILFGVVALLLVFFVCYKLIYQSSVKKAAYYNRLSRKESQRNQLRKEQYKLALSKNDYGKMIVYKQDIDGIKNKLSKLALDSGAKVLSISSTRQKDPSGYQIFLPKIELACSYHQLGEFVEKIENSTPYIGIKSVEIKAGGERRRSRNPWGMPGFNRSQIDIGDASHASLILEIYSIKK